MTSTISPLLAKAVQADIARDGAAHARTGRFSALRRRRNEAKARRVTLVPAMVRFERPATW